MSVKQCDKYGSVARYCTYKMEQENLELSFIGHLAY